MFGEERPGPTHTGVVSGLISDKHHYVPAVLTGEAVAAFLAADCGELPALHGAILHITNFVFVSHQQHIECSVAAFSSVGAYGSMLFGDPKPIPTAALGAAAPAAGGEPGEAGSQLTTQQLFVGLLDSVIPASRRRRAERAAGASPGAGGGETACNDDDAHDDDDGAPFSQAHGPMTQVAPMELAVDAPPTPPLESDPAAAPADIVRPVTYTLPRPLTSRALLAMARIPSDQDVMLDALWAAGGTSAGNRVPDEAGDEETGGRGKSSGAVATPRGGDDLLPPASSATADAAAITLPHAELMDLTSPETASASQTSPFRLVRPPPPRSGPSSVGARSPAPSQHRARPHPPSSWLCAQRAKPLARWWEAVTGAAVAPYM
ncbi:hypothetical protein, variant [Thecamonas trahens ATCC 50062]|uniref:Uncharacterized protein n=1 Tax=Thecamonas trahens ATCC 50062 TaxID=461836 RepID=A0A0L0DVC3_THETB|nr:hypothetical protein, variant [Thecamonas trahens ATCC 50062]KNC56165.1 hypothetical protein, variant [Thecamonas trahens ATCC 50062]|eukprot:XP_013761202.1 hypothetical protein, variant [Thecamonas trahens ATCC 50062]